MHSQCGGIKLNMLLIVLMGALMATGYMLWNQKSESMGTNFSAGSPQIQRPPQQENVNTPFTDGLIQAISIKKHEPDETGAGVTSTEIFAVDINNDGSLDRITKTHHESGTAHFWDEYKIELNQKGKYRNITPNGFRTTVGAECALQKLQFVFKPKFYVVKISRSWRDSWDTPSMATRTIYTIQNNKLIAGQPEQLESVCDVTELFKK
ncbi:MAG: hypothetical protein J6R52_04670 [Alphaproteobacteria bacterium]|nr:hypothetical protein [Alphaproteobacteria bacterium]